MLKDTPGSEHPNENGEIAYVTGHGFKLYDGTEKGLREPDVGLTSVDTTTTTTSVTDVLMSGMSTTPSAGEYLVVLAGDLSHNASGGQIYTSIYVAGSQRVGSQRFYQRQGAVNGQFVSFAKVGVNGAQAIEGRWRVNSGTGTNYNRQLLLIKVAETGLTMKLASMMERL